ncbi:class I SAM-dependent methyltransferase [Patescibacteria group bacterium]
MISKNTDNLRRDIAFKTKLREHDFVFHSTWGLFSPAEIDAGSKMLIDQVEIKPADNTLDIGCGYGPIGLAIAKLSPEGQVHLIDKDFVAIDYAKKNAKLNNIDNTKIYLSNGFDSVPEIKFDTIVSNIPAKVGNEMMYLMITDAKKHLKKNGKLYVVVISGLKDYIKRNFREVFGNYKKIQQGKKYTVAVAIKE